MKVMVAMSGGVDSAVAALLLQREGHDVVGVTMSLWSAGDEEEGAGCAPDDACCSLDSVEEARRVARRLGIEHHVFNLRSDFASTVIKDFAEEYVRGRTPNPCIRCNEWMKFGILLTRAQALGADAVATGHYALIGEDVSTGRRTLHRSPGNPKDQSYALYGLTQFQLAHALTPLGWLDKDRVREIARESGLSVADKAESQDICFAPDGDHVSVVQAHDPSAGRPGEFVDRSGEVFGTHRGVHHYTIGQRKGLGLSLPEPRYVVSIDVHSNQVILGEKEELRVNGFTMSRCNWVGVTDPPVGVPLLLQARYRQEPVEATVVRASGSAIDPTGEVEVEIAGGLDAVAPGQAAVLYDGDEVMGGGTVERTW